MGVDQENPGDGTTSCPESVLDWLSEGRPRPMPSEVRAWLDRDPDHSAVLEDLVEVWDSTTPAAVPANLWSGIEARIAGAPPADAGGGVDTPSDLATARSRRSRRRTAWSTPLRLAAMLVVGLGIGLLWPALQARLAPETQRVTVEVPAGSRSTLTLPGGVDVRLNSLSRLTYPAGGDEVEQVTLEGEAYFEVRHDPARSFSVLTSGGVIRDIGTEFNVQARDDGVAVVVTEGEVELTSAGVTLSVVEGQKARAEASARPRMEPDFLLSAELAWLEGRLAFHAAPLDQIAAALERHYDVSVTVAPELRDRRVTLVLDAPPEVSSAIDIVCQAVSTRCERTGNAWRIGSDG